MCDIDVGKEYFWYSGIWHGLFFEANFIRHVFLDSDIPYKAEIYTTAYNVWYWISSVFSTIGFICGICGIFGIRRD